MKWVMIAQSVWTPKGVRGSKDSENPRSALPRQSGAKAARIHLLSVSTWFKGGCAAS